MKNSENILIEIKDQLKTATEWLLIYSTGRSFSLQNNEIELCCKNNKIFISFLNDSGFQTWRIVNFAVKNSEILLGLTRNFERESEKIRFVPHISTIELIASVTLARLEKANKLAVVIKENLHDLKLMRVALNKENGRFARIILQESRTVQRAFLCDVSETITPEVVISTTILWLSKLELRKKNQIEKVNILAEKKTLNKLRKLHALLCENWKRRINLWELSNFEEKSPSQKIILQESLNISDLWRERSVKNQLTENNQISRTAQEIIKIAPEKIDLMFTKRGETLCFEGLPFARIRKTLSEEKCWFGIEREQRILNEDSRKEFFELVENLEIYRRFDSPNKRHALFQLSPEAWLEGILRRNIKRLDTNLILSPVHNQFRADRDKIDLLALRRDGRLIIIELKVMPNREMIFQAADYWRKIELNRRKGNLQKLKLFGELKISDAPTIVYLVAPTLSFHRDFSFFTQTISPDIEIFRFNLNESWREDLQVMDVEKLGKK